VIQARGSAALATVWRSDTGWDELEAAWRDAMATEGLAEHAGLMGAIIGWTAALHHNLDRADRYMAETTTFCAHHDLGMFQPMAIAADGLVEFHRGDWGRAGALAEDVLTRPGLIPVHRILAAPNPVTSSAWGQCGRRAPRRPGWPATTTPRVPRRATG
jgi:hypothetical protein